MKGSLLTALLLAGVLHLSHPVRVHADSFPPTHGVTHMVMSENVGRFSAGHPLLGRDDLDDPDAIWHWEVGIDVLGIPPGTYPVSINGGPPQLRVFGGPGPDIYADFHQDPDEAGAVPGIGRIPGLPGLGTTCLGGGQETGPICKLDVNLTPYVTMWVVSVGEGPPPAPLGTFGETIRLLRRGRGFEIQTTPEPASLVLVGSALAGVLWRRKKVQGSAAA